MENNKQSDKNIKGMFENYQPEIDTNAVWENIEPKLKKKKNRRFILFFLLFGAGMLAWFFYANQNFGVENLQPKISDNQSVTQSELVENSPETIEADIEADVEMATNETNAQPENEVNYYEYQASALTSNETEFYEIEHTTFVESKSGDFENSVDPEALTSTEIETEDAPIFESNESERSEQFIPETENLQPEFSTPIIKETTEKEEFNQTEKKRSKKVKKKKKRKKKATKKKKRKKKKRKRRRIKRMKHISFRPYVQVFAAPEYGFRSLTTPTTEGNNQWVNMRNSTEQQLEAFSFGTNLQLVHKNGFIIMGGGEFRRINGRYKEVEIEERSVVENGITSITVNSAGDTIDIGYGLKEKLVTTEKTNIRQNYFQFLNVPFGIGYHHTNRKGGWKILGGLNLNIAYYMEASYLDRSGSLVSYDNQGLVASNAFKQKASANLWASFEYFRKIGPKTQWMIAPRIEVPTGGLTNLDVYPISQRFFPIGIKTGFNFRLGKSPKKKKKGKVEKKK